MSDDRLIDDIAREMTQGQPGGDFRARVVARIAGHPPRARRPWIGSPIAVAAGIVLVVLVAYGIRDRDRDRHTAGPPRRAAAAPPAAPIRTPQEPFRSRDRQGVATRRAATRIVPVRPSTSDTGAAAIAALAPPPLEVETIAISNIAPDSIQVPALEAIGPIAVAPIQNDKENQP